MITLPGNAKMDGNLLDVPLTQSYANIQNEGALPEDSKREGMHLQYVDFHSICYIF